MRFVLTIVTLFLVLPLFSQPTERAIIRFENNGDIYRYALAGGLNNPQFSNVDLNNDGTDDLFIFDKKGDVLLPFLHTGDANTSNFRYAPEYIGQFPRFTDWMILKDYNCDGIADIFGFNQIPGIFGVEVYKGSYNNDNQIQFEKLLFPENTFDNLFYLNPFIGLNSSILVTSEDIPAIEDIDGDSDIDILTFNPAGGYVEYFENQSADLGFGCDSLLFELVDNCWGRFFESGISESLDLSPAQDSCLFRDDFIGKSGSVHIGSTVLAIDMDGDQDKELILGDLSFSNLNLLMNGGNPDTAFITSQINDFPSATTPVDLSSFPGGFYTDVNNDNVKDLLVAPNATNISENFFCSWYYRNNGSNDQPSFQYMTNTFLVDEMIDFGSEAYPTFFDHNGDGLMDIVVGNGGFFLGTGQFDTRLFLFENVGTAAEPAFDLVDENYANLMALNLQSLHPAFADIDDDGDLDMMVGNANGDLFYYENTDNGNGLAVFNTFVANYQGIDIGTHSTPYFVDLNRDDLIDLIIGERLGTVNYYQNTGTLNNPVFTLVNQFLGNIDTREPNFPSGYSQPIVIEENGEYVIYTGSDPGNIKRWTDVEDNIFVGDFIEADSAYADIFEGQRTRIDAADITNDGKLEFVVGNLRGGFAIYSEEMINTVSIRPPLLDAGEVSIFPNPTGDALFVEVPQAKQEYEQLQIWNVAGQLVRQELFTASRQVDVSQLASGVYILNLITSEGVLVKKFVKR